MSDEHQTAAFSQVGGGGGRCTLLASTPNPPSWIFCCVLGARQAGRTRALTVHGYIHVLAYHEVGRESRVLIYSALRAAKRKNRSHHGWHGGGPNVTSPGAQLEREPTMASAVPVCAPKFRNQRVLVPSARRRADSPIAHLSSPALPVPLTSCRYLVPSISVSVVEAIHLHTAQYLVPFLARWKRKTPNLNHHMASRGGHPPLPVLGILLFPRGEEAHTLESLLMSSPGRLCGEPTYGRRCAIRSHLPQDDCGTAALVVGG